MILLLVVRDVCAYGPEGRSGALRFDAIPSDAVAVYFHPGPAADARGSDARTTLELAGFLADRACEMGLLSKVDSTVRLWIDVLASMSVVLRYPHAIVLLDIRARPRGDGGHRLGGLHAAVIVDTAGAAAHPPQADSNSRIEQRIQHLLNAYANSEDTVLTTRTRQGGGAGGAERRFELRDRRLPSWAMMTWGSIRGRYVVAIGDGTFDRVAETMRDRSRSLATDPWFTRAYRAAGGGEIRPGRGCGWYVHFDRLRTGSDPDQSGLVDKIDRVLGSLRLAGAQRGLWMVRTGSGPTGRARAVEVAGVVRRDGEDIRSVVADHRFLAGLGEPVIPDAATGYAIIDCNPQAVFEALCAAYLGTRSPAAQDGSRRFWRGVQERAGVSIERDIVSRLGRSIVIHDYPRHALRLPLMWTVLVRIEGDPDALRVQVDRLLDYAREELARAGRVQLHHDSDGVWYLQLGINGPALAVTERWLIISFSPHAVRQNIAFLYPVPASSAGEGDSNGEECRREGRSRLGAGHSMRDPGMGGMAKRSAAMSRGCLTPTHNMPALLCDGLGHAIHPAFVLPMMCGRVLDSRMGTVAVVAGPDMVICDWTWIRADPEHPHRPIGRSERFDRLLWSTD